MTTGQVGLDPYETLGVTRLATEGDIRLAYRHLVKRCHPDLHPGDSTLEDRIRLINQAYAILSDPVARATLDIEPGDAAITQPDIQPTPQQPRRTRTSRREIAQRAAADRARAKQRAVKWRQRTKVAGSAALIVTMGVMLVRLVHPVDMVLALQDHVTAAQLTEPSPILDPRLSRAAVIPPKAPAAAVPPLPASHPLAKPASDPCGMGTACYNRKTYGRSGWFIRRGRGNEHPS